MPYRRSPPLMNWLGQRRESLSVLAAAHQHVARIAGPGRPAEIGRRLAHAYIMQQVADFQRFARELHDLAIDSLAKGSGAGTAFHMAFIAAARHGRALDRGNPTFDALQADFVGLGFVGLRRELKSENPKLDTDRTTLQDLIAIRNAIAHGDARRIDKLKARGVRDTRTWASSHRASLNRIAAALDKVIWIYLNRMLRIDPW